MMIIDPLVSRPSTAPSVPMMLGVLPILLPVSITFTSPCALVLAAPLRRALSAKAFPKPDPASNRHAFPLIFLALLLHPPILCVFFAVIDVSNANDYVPSPLAQPCKWRRWGQIWSPDLIARSDRT